MHRVATSRDEAASESALTCSTPQEVGATQYVPVDLPSVAP
ncbi:MAG: hypothetical protein ACYDBQ_02670 [Thermoplasmatota archaeon]